MDLSTAAAIATGLAISIYICLDGFDLGVGVLLLFAGPEEMRDRMVASIAPTWDGNETWLIMAGIIIFAAFPLAYATLLPALYMPIIAMLLSLGLRGVSFEFRYQTTNQRFVWDSVFFAGSVVAALMQGVIAGTLVSGVHSFHPVLVGTTALAVLAGYMMIGAGWLHFKGDGDMRRYAERILRISVPVFGFLAALPPIVAYSVQPGVAARWNHLPGLYFGLATLAVVLLMAQFARIGKTPDIIPFLCGLGLFGLGLFGFGMSIFPYAVPYEVTIWAAASPGDSQLFLLIGVGIVAPVVVAYSLYAYFVFRGKTPVQGWEQ